ncbi:hypothetical protein FHS15_003048 [Paenibacillus castaneae]|nr:transposase [Paenibacillus castaneae]NIK77910.1 hypothetical protein [Paenibacillus castaneae]
MIEPESVFGQIKNNRGFRRSLLRSLPKVSLEVGWLSLANSDEASNHRPKEKNSRTGIDTLYGYFFMFSNISVRSDLSFQRTSCFWDTSFFVNSRTPDRQLPHTIQQDKCLIRFVKGTECLYGQYLH